MEDLVFASLQTLAMGIRDRQVSAREVMEAHLAQVDRHNPQLNVIVTLDRERARARAREADEALARGEVWGPLHGVPFTAKDGFATAGLRTTSGYPPWVNFVPDTDAPVVARIREAGAILLGKTNLPTLSMDVQTDNPIFGRTNNPWDLSRTCGGSTGGAAAVAAGLTPLELGADLAGSVRIPAHFCGVYSLKPSEFRMPDGGYHPNPAPAPPGTGGPGLATFGPLARSVEDLALALRVMACPHPRSWWIPPVPAEPLPALGLKQLRLAWADDFGGVPISTETRAALAQLAEALQREGCRIERAMPEAFDLAAAWETWGELVAVMLGTPPDTASDSGVVTPLSRGLRRGPRLVLREYLASLRRRGALIEALERFLEQWDALICPVTATPAFPHCVGEPPILVDGQPVDYSMATMSYTCPFNLTGHPVVVLPIARSGEGLPIGVQVVGRRWGEMPLLAVARCIAEVIGPFQRPQGY